MALDFISQFLYQHVTSTNSINLISLYVILIASLFGLLFLRKIGSFLLRLVYYRIRASLLKHVTYALLWRRYPGSATRLQGLSLLVYMIMNGFCMGLGIHSVADLLSRTGLMAVVNMIPLFLGGRTSVVADFLGISLHSYYLLHHWIGRLVVLQSLLHVGLAIAKKETALHNLSQISGVTAASALALMLMLSLNFIRQIAYELFLKSHFLLGMGALVAVFLHLQPQGWTRFVYPAAAMGLWAVGALLRLSRVLYNNWGRHRYNQIDIRHHKDRGRTTALEIVVHLRRPLKVRPGQYFYLFFSDLGLRRQLQAHPFMVSWWDNAARARELTFLVYPQRGMSLDLASRTEIRSVVLDGPYGKQLKTKNYESVQLFAKGPGIVGVIGHVLSLVERKNHPDQSYRRGLLTRKVDLIWVMEENFQANWVTSWIEQLMAKDPERELILQVFLYYPTEVMRKEPNVDPYYRRFYSKDPKIPELILQQLQRTPGRTLIAVCGNTDFTTPIRMFVQELLCQDSDIRFEEVEYRPAETQMDEKLMRGVEMELSGLVPDVKFEPQLLESGDISDEKFNPLLLEGGETESAPSTKLRTFV